MLDCKSIEIIKETLPAVKDSGKKIVFRMYEILFSEYPDLVKKFNMSNLKSENSAQVVSLSQAIVAYGEHIDNPEPLLSRVQQIAHRHVARSVEVHDYEKVGSALLQAVKDILKVPEHIVTAWGEAYWQLAKIFIDVEKGMYSALPWSGLRKFVVADKQKESDDTYLFTVQPFDAQAVPEFAAGSFVNVYLDAKGAGREYSLTKRVKSNAYQFCVKQGVGSSFSDHLCRELKVGAVVELSAPCGSFKFKNNQESAVFIAGGIGVTPFVAMTDDFLKKSRGELTVLHCVKNEKHQPFLKHFKKITKNQANVYYHDLHAEPTEFTLAKHNERLSLNILQIYVEPNQDYYISGSSSFVRDVKSQLIELGVDSDDIYSEQFEPVQA